MKSSTFPTLCLGLILMLQRAEPQVDRDALPWDISQIGAPSTRTNASGNPVMVLKYVMSDREYDVKVTKNDCLSPTSVPVLYYEDSFNNLQGYIDVEVSLTINQADVEASDIWIDSATSSESSLDGSFSFCLVSSLYSSGDNNNKNHTEENVVLRSNSIFNVDVDKRSNLDITRVDVGDDEPDVVDDFVVHFVGHTIAYQCDPVTMEAWTDPQPPVLGRNDVLNLCVEVSNENVTVETILDLTLEQRDTYTTFVAFENGVAKFESLTETRCSHGKCLVRLVLIDNFFASDVSHPIHVEGTVLLDFENSSGRHRSHLRSDRRGNEHRHKGGKVTLERKGQRPRKKSVDFGLLIEIDVQESCGNAAIGSYHEIFASLLSLFT